MPQGTVLGPLLSLILIDSLGDIDMDALVASFCDDTKVSLTIENEEDAQKLQDCLDKLYKWQLENNMSFNAEKFLLLQFGKNNDLKIQYNYMTPNCDSNILPTDNVRDLGVQVDNDGSFNTHINKICTKAKQRIGFLLRTFNTRSIEFMRFAFKSYILPILDYSSQLWAPLEGHNMNKIENILRSFSSKVNGLKYLNYWERLEKLKLFSMTRRYERYRMIYTWKILTNNAHNCGLL